MFFPNIFARKKQKAKTQDQNQKFYRSIKQTLSTSNVKPLSLLNLKYLTHLTKSQFLLTFETNAYRSQTRAQHVK